MQYMNTMLINETTGEIYILSTSHPKRAKCIPSSMRTIDHFFRSEFHNHSWVVNYNNS